MAIQTIKTMVPRPAAEPRFSRGIGALLSWVLPRPTARSWRHRAAARVRRTLEEMGRARAEREMLQLAARYESSQPGLAKELRAAASENFRGDA